MFNLALIPMSFLASVLVWAPPAADAPVDTAERLLDRLEADAAHLNDFKARIRVEKESPVLGDVEANLGEVFMHFDHERGVKKFAVRFEHRIVNDRMRERREIYIFDGVWLVERIDETKQFIKKQMVAPGETFDPLRLGEGPIPLPIAQRKKDVLQRFEATLIDPPEEGFLGRALAGRQVIGLQLIPRPGFPEAKEFAQVRIWYDRELLLPVGVIAEKIGSREERGEETTVCLWNVERNIGIDAATFDTTPPSDPDWRIDVREWQGDQ